MKTDKIDEIISGKPLTIKCPHCGYEYAPAEIFIPTYFLGKPTDIERTQEGKIDIIQGLAPQLEETFECDSCHDKFSVKANLSFTTTPITKDKFSEEYSSPLYRDRITLKED